MTTLAPIFTSFSRSVVSDHVCEKGRMSALGQYQKSVTAPNFARYAA